jgi:hypothetical protein
MFASRINTPDTRVYPFHVRLNTRIFDLEMEDFALEFYGSVSVLFFYRILLRLRLS